MLLIALLGPVGSGKTTLLRELAGWWHDTGKEAGGFVAEGCRQAPGLGGADRYDLVMLGDSRRLPYAVRDSSLAPPYRFDGETTEALGQWAERLAAGSPPSLLILDEFGPIEAAGGGHISLWPRICSSGPQIVVMAVRKGLEGAVAARLQREFDVLIDIQSPQAREKLQQACDAHADWMRIGLYGGASGGFEATVGAVLHGGEVPLRGLLMSSMESVIMTYAANGLRQRRRVIWVSFLAASIKAFSPTGSRVRPMIAITMQGFLYTVAITLFGWNVAGAALGGFLIGTWSALQAVALQYLLVGGELIRAYDSIIQMLALRLRVESIGFLALVAGWTAVCGLVVGLVTVLAWKRRHAMPRRLHEVLFEGAKGVRLELRPASIPQALGRGLRDIARPLFWLPVAIVGGVMLATGSPVESILWVALRAAGVGFVLFSVVRAFDPVAFIKWLRRRGHWGPSLAYHRVLDRFGRPDQPPPERGA